MIGRVLNAHIDDRFVIDPERRYIVTPGLKLIARLHASGGYLRSTDRFDMVRPSWAKRQAKRPATPEA